MSSYNAPVDLISSSSEDERDDPMIAPASSDESEPDVIIVDDDTSPPPPDIQLPPQPALVVAPTPGGGSSVGAPAEPKFNHRRARACIGVSATEAVSRRLLESRINAIQRVFEERIEKNEGNVVELQDFLNRIDVIKTVLLADSVCDCKFSLGEIVWVKVSNVWLYWPGVIVASDVEEADEVDIKVIDGVKVKYFGDWEDEFFIGNVSDLMPFVSSWDAAQAEGAIDCESVVRRKDCVKEAICQYMVEGGREPVELKDNERWERFMRRSHAELKSIDADVIDLYRMVGKSVLREKGGLESTPKRKSMTKSDRTSSQGSKRRKKEEKANGKRKGKGKGKAVEPESSDSDESSEHESGGSNSSARNLQDGSLVASRVKVEGSVHRTSESTGEGGGSSSSGGRGGGSQAAVLNTKRTLRDRKVVVDNEGKSLVVGEVKLDLQLWGAVTNGDIEATRELVEKVKADPSIDDIYKDPETSDTLLHAAVPHNNLELMKLVADAMTFQLGNSGRPFIVDSVRGGGGRTALHVALGKQALAIIPFLLTHVYNINVVDNEGQSCIHFLASEGDDAKQILTARLLLEWDTPPDIDEDIEEDIEHDSTEWEGISTAEALRCEIHPGRRSDLNRPLERNKLDHKKRTVLFWAVEENYVELAAYLISEGCWHSQKDVGYLAEDFGTERYKIKVQDVRDEDGKQIIPKFAYSTKCVGNPRDPKFKPCSCKGVCDHNSCPCSKKNGSLPPYDQWGLLNGSMTKYECGDECNSCPCEAGHRMKMSQRGAVAGLSVCHSPERGFGVKTSTELRAGVIVCIYTGRVISLEEVNERIPNEPWLGFFEGKLYMMEIIDKKRSFAIDASTMGNLGRLVNHSCSPNMRLQKIYNGFVYPTIAFVANQNIPANTELTISYHAGSISKNRNSAGQEACHCGESNCTGFLRS